MRRYERQQVTTTREVEVEARCDDCGIDEKDALFGLTPVAIEVNYGNEFGRRDDYDYCQDCLPAHAEALKAAGSRSEIVGAQPPEDPERADDD